MYQGIVNRAVTVWMVFTHGVTDDTCTLTMWLVRSQSQLLHGVEDTSLHRLQAVPDIRQGTGNDNAHGVVAVGITHFLRKI